jgi:uncharacterized protein (DUF4415 family)
MSENKAGMKTNWVDPDDAPELTEAWFEKADFQIGDRLVRRGRPAGSGRKVSTTIRFDADILDAFKAAGAGWQTRLNQALREWLVVHKP